MLALSAIDLSSDTTCELFILRCFIFACYDAAFVMKASQSIIVHDAIKPAKGSFQHSGMRPGKADNCVAIMK